MKISSDNEAIIIPSVIIALLFHWAHALSTNKEWNRRCLVNHLGCSVVALTTISTIPTISNASSPQGGTPIQGAGGSYIRVEGIGSGFDIRTSTTIKGQDVIYPSSMVGLWNCRRVVTSVEGDSGQAELAWRNLGGRGSIKDIESFDTRFLLPSDEFNIDNSYSFEGEMLKGVVLDRGFEIESRNHECKATWTLEMPNVLSYVSDDSPSGVEIVVVQRKIELPSEKGFGFNELYRITSSAGGIFGDNKVQRAVRVQRRYRRALDDEGNRIVEGLEIMKTFRVLDGIAGTEMPTSTTKSQMKLRRN